MIKQLNENDLDTLGSAYTITGAGDDLNEWVKGYENLLVQENIGKPQEWYTFSGKIMNDKYNLTGNNRYPDDLTFLCFSLENLNVGKLAIFKLKMQDCWFDDIVMNNLSKEEIEVENDDD